MAQKYPGQITFVSENFGDSELAERFGVQRYPAVFLDDVLVAKPKDFGFFGESGSQGAGRYTPWLEAENQERFRADMERLVGKAIRGELSSADGVATGEGTELTELPDFSLPDLEGNPITSEDLRGAVTVIDFWATWCPPCIKSLPWYSNLQRAHGDSVRIVGIVVESDEEEVRAMADKFKLPFPTLFGTPELAADFGDLVAVPTAFVFDRGGRLVRTFFGAPPDLKQELEDLVSELIAVEPR